MEGERGKNRAEEMSARREDVKKGGGLEMESEREIDA